MEALPLQPAIASKPAANGARAPLLGDPEANTLPTTFIGFLFVTLNSIAAIVRSHGDAAAVAFIGFSYADLVALFLCLRMYERAGAGSAKRTWLKIAVWILTALLTFAFSGKVAAAMPPPVAVLVWLMAFATVAGGFVAFFVCQEKKEAAEEQCWEETA